MWLRTSYHGDAPVPGTIHLVGLDGTIQTKHAKGAVKDVVLVPVPSSGPDNPPSWSPFSKALSTTCMGICTLMVRIALAAIYSMLTPISTATNLTLDSLNSGAVYMFLAFDWGCLF